MSEDTTNRWLILDQETDRREWSGSACEGLIWNEGGVTAGRPMTGQSPADAEICILFLPCAPGGRSLPEHFDNRIAWRWNVWCHYGRDITLSEVPVRWRGYERLTVAEKDRLSEDGTRPPYPFSRVMPQDWTDQFRELKQRVSRNAQAGSAASKDDFLHCLRNLRKAWELATGSQSVQMRIDQSKEALPAVLAARFILDALPEGARALQVLKAALSLCQQCGLTAMAPRKEYFSTEVRDAYRSLNFTLLRLQAELIQVDQRIAADLVSDLPRGRREVDATIVSGIKILRKALNALLKVAQTDGDGITKVLTTNPRRMKPRSSPS